MLQYLGVKRWSSAFLGLKNKSGKKPQQAARTAVYSECYGYG
jgi:hypothetical protein